MRYGLWVGALAWVACGGGVGTESPEPSAPVTVMPQVPAAPVAPAAPEPEGTPSPTPTPPPTPSTRAVAPQFGPTQCSRTQYRQDGSLELWETLGAEGLVREQHWFFPDGREGSSYVQEVAEGRVTVRDSFSGGQRQQHSEWRYGERGELLRSEYVSGTAGPRSAEDYVYGPQGQLSHADISSEGVLHSRRSYLYEGERLVRIETRYTDNPFGPGYLHALSAFTHHPNGQVKHVERWSESINGIRGGFSTDFDESGRLLVSESYGDESSSRAESSYDASRRLSRIVTRFESSRGSAFREESFVYDEAGRVVLRHFVSDYTDRLSERVTSTRETWRSEYGARGELVLRTVDLDEDGVPEGRRSFMYDAAGRLVEERLEGRAPWDQSGRVVYTYGCQDAGDGA